MVLFGLSIMAMFLVTIHRLFASDILNDSIETTGDCLLVDLDQKESPSKRWLSSTQRTSTNQNTALQPCINHTKVSMGRKTGHL